MAAPFAECIQLTAANTNRDGTGTIVDARTAAATLGERLERIRVQAVGPTTAGFIHLYRKKSGGSYRFEREWPVAAVSAQDITNGKARWFLDVDCSLMSEAIYLLNGDKLAFTTDKGETFNVTAQGVSI